MPDNIDSTAELTFEQAISRLEEIVRRLESGSAPLDESLTLFEEGVAMVKLCNSRLDNAEAKVKLVYTAPDGTSAERDFTE